MRKFVVPKARISDPCIGIKSKIFKFKASGGFGSRHAQPAGHSLSVFHLATYDA